MVESNFRHGWPARRVTVASLRFPLGKVRRIRALNDRFRDLSLRSCVMKLFVDWQSDGGHRNIS